jgi:hypothetical protein
MVVALPALIAAKLVRVDVAAISSACASSTLHGCRSLDQRIITPYPVAQRLRRNMQAARHIARRSPKSDHLPNRRFPELRRVDPLRYPSFHLTFLDEALEPHFMASV